ncbi:MAG TPA: type III-A CRISPR-associated RAMP protein Csm5 [Methanobacterium sp.]|jgi:CRISPR type III-A-associated RAMP protein Csm5|nr:type III-A CRISPR-associated RAMP protein Csm5 [Methanobacterium sp.]
MKMKIETITPVHIGSGSDYGSPEFYMAKAEDRNVVVRADINHVFMMLPDEWKDQFIIELEDPKFNLQSFLGRVMKQLPKGSLGKIRLYYSYLKSQVPENIAEHVKTSHQAYIPGSSLKGSVKSALLYDLVDDDSISRVESLIKRGRKGKPEIKLWDSQRFVDSLLSSDARKAPNTSIMRFLQVTDTSPVRRMSIHSVNSVKVHSTGWGWYKHSEDIGTTYMETIDVGNELEFDMNFNQKESVIKKLNLEYKQEYLSPESVLDCIYRFSDDLIENEIEFAKNYRVKFLEDFYEDLSEINTPEGPVINVGQGTGFLAKTIGLKIRKYDKENYTQIYDKVRESTRGRNYPEEFPKTRRIVMEDKVPMGWVKVELK